MAYESNSSKVRSFKDLDWWKKEHENYSKQEYLNSKLDKYLAKDERNNPHEHLSFKNLDSWKSRNETDLINPDEIIKKTNFSRSLNLTSTPLSYLPEDEMIIYLNDTLYFLSEDAKTNDNKISFSGKPHYLIEFGPFLSVEKEYLNKNLDEINSFKTDYIKKLAKENTLINEKYASIENSLKDTDSIDSLVKNYFFPVTKNIDLERIIAENKNRENMNKEIDASKIRDIEFNHKTSFFNNIVGNKNSPLLITGGKYYEISCELKFVSDKRNIESKYKNFISDKIKSKIKEKVDSYFLEVLKKGAGLRNLNKAVSDATSSPHKDFGADKINQNEYVLFKDTGEYGVEWDGKFYIFPPTKVGINMTKTYSGYQIGDRAFVYKDPQYKHPYVQGKKGKIRREICTAGRLNIIHSQIGFKKSEKDKAHLMESAKLLLNRFDNILKNGHNSDHNPIDSIPESARLISRSEAEQYKRRGIEFFRKIDGN